MVKVDRTAGDVGPGPWGPRNPEREAIVWAIVILWALALLFYVVGLPFVIGWLT